MPLLFSFAGIVQGFLWVLLVITMFLLIGVVLLQEGKGGGLAEAFGGAGAETFGVKAHGINKFTALIGGLFLVLCVVLAKIKVEPDATPLDPDFKPEAPRNANGEGMGFPDEGEIPVPPAGESGGGAPPEKH